MAKRFSRTFLLAALATVVFIILAAAVPAALFARADEALYTQPLERRRESGLLSAEGEDLYLVRTLHARAQLLQTANNGYAPQTANLPGLRRRITPVLNTLAKAGILPASLGGELGTLVEREGSLAGYYVDQAGFEQILFRGEEEDAVLSFGIELEPRTGFVVALWVTTNNEIAGYTPRYGLNEALEAYKTWLGLDGLDDWQDGGLPHYNWQQTSQKGLVQLYLRCQGKTLHFGVAALGGNAAEA